jgi:hypothetical protein
MPLVRPVDNALQGLYKKFPGLKRDLIKSIRHSKFVPRMLFKLRYGQGVNTDRRTQEVLIQDGKIEKTILRITVAHPPFGSKGSSTARPS